MNSGNEQKRIDTMLFMTGILFFAFILGVFGDGDAFGQNRPLPGTYATAGQTDEKPLPDLKLNTIDGKKWSLYDNRGEVVLINFWATWCLPCRTKTPMLVRLGKEYKERGLEIVGIALDENGMAVIKQFVGEYKIDYPILLPVPGSALSRIDPVPTTLLIDRKGRLAKKYVGELPEDILRADIEKLTAEKPALKKQATKKARSKIILKHPEKEPPRKKAVSTLARRSNF